MTRLTIAVHAALLAGMLAAGGCADLQTTTYQAAIIDQQAAMYYSLQTAPGLPVTIADTMELMARTLEDYYAKGTTNVFVYWFDPNKPILLTPTLYGDLKAAATAVRRFVAEWKTYTVDLQILHMHDAATWIVDVKKWKDAQRSITP